ncbi:hypothetical protein ACRRTK_001912 [Alexandromys fortis]
MIPFGTGEETSMAIKRGVGDSYTSSMKQKVYLLKSHLKILKLHANFIYCKEFWMYLSNRKTTLDLFVHPFCGFP